MNTPRATKIKTTTRTVVLQEFAGLEGVDITVYQGTNGVWHGDVLLDPQLWREGDLPVHCVAGSYRTEAATGRWWWNPER